MRFFPSPHSARGLFLCVLIMQRLKIRVFYLAKASVKILLIAASSIATEDAGTFPQGCKGGDAISVFQLLHKILLSFFIRMEERLLFYSFKGNAHRKWRDLFRIFSPAKGDFISISLKERSDKMAYYGKVEISGVNTASLPVLSGTEARKLFIKCRKGDETARQKLIEGNLRLVLSIIKRFENRNENMDDLFQIGVVGLIKAIDNFNIDMDVMPSTYFCPMIIGEIRRYLRDNNTIRVSRSLRDTAYKALQVKERLMAETEKEPSMEEIAKEMGLSRENIVMAMDAIQDPVSLFEPIYHDGGDTLFVMDQVSDEKNGDKLWLENLSLNEAMHHLSEREKKIVNLRFFEGKTQTEVSSEIGISQAQVSRLEKSALQHMRKYM